MTKSSPENKTAAGHEQPGLSICFPDHATRALLRLGASVEGLLSHGTGQIIAHYLLTFPHGMPAYDPKAGRWDFYGEDGMTGNLIVSITEDRWLHVYEGEDGGTVIRIRIRDVAELPEVLRFLEEVTPEQLSTEPVLASLPLSSVIERIWMGLPGLSHPERTVIWTQSGDLLSLPNFLAVPHIDRGLPLIGLQLSPGSSFLFFLEFFDRTPIGREILKSLVRAPEKTTELLKTTALDYPAGWHEEMLLGIKQKTASP